MPSPPEQRPPLALAMEWVSRIMVVGLEMVLPGLGGGWLDERWGTKPLFALVGFGLGIVGGMAHLLMMTGTDNRRQKSQRDESERDQSRRSEKSLERPSKQSKPPPDQSA